MLPILYPPRPEGAPSYFEPGDGRGYLETLQDWTPSAAGVARLGVVAASPEGRELTGAAASSSALNRYLSSRDRALEEATDLRIDGIRRATGVELQNPYRNGYNVEARARVAARRLDPDFDPRAGIPGAARDIFNEQIADVIAKHGDKVADLDLHVPIEDKARAIATAAEDALPGVRVRTAAGGMSPQQQTVLEGAGAMWAGFKDPLTLFSLAAGPGFGFGRTAAMRVLTEAVGQGSFNVGLLLAEHPTIEAWRQERGRAPGGHLPSLAETSVAFLAGAIPGAGTRIAFELLPKVRPDITPDVIRAAERTAEADRMVADAIPPHVSRETGEEVLAQSARHAADPAHEPPPSPIVAHETSGERAAELAEIVRRADNDPAEVVEAMRSIRELGAAGAASGNENLVNAAKMASLSEPAWQAVKDGRVPPGNALIAAEHAPNPSDHLPVLERLEREAPQTSKEARVIAADEVAGQASKSDVVALQAQVAEKPRIGTVPEERRSLLQFLAGRGGIAHTDELRALFGDRSSYVRPYGKLLKEDSEQLAVRAEQAFTAGYIAEPSEKALLAAIGTEVGGAKVYRTEFAAQGAERDAAKAASKETKAAKEQARADLFNYLAETGSEIRPSFPGSEVSNRRIFKEAVGLLARGEETDVAAALRRAASQEFDKEAGKATSRRKSADKQDPMDMLPAQAEDGTAVLLSREETALRIEDRQSLADLVRACKE